MKLLPIFICVFLFFIEMSVSAETAKEDAGAKTDKNWLSEGLKQKEAESKQQEAAIDEILERNKKQQSNSPKDNNQEIDSNRMKPAISTTAWEPLEPATYSRNSPKANQSQHSNTIESYKKFDEKTGIANVFFNPLTGNFENSPVNLDRPREKQNPFSINNQNDLADKKKVEDFEANLIQIAKAQNKLPPSYANNLEKNSFTNGNIRPQTNESSYAASAAKLRLMEEERIKNEKAANRTTAMDIHGPAKGKGIEINPRF